MPERIVSFCIETKLGDHWESFDLLKWAQEAAGKRAKTLGQPFVVLRHMDTNGEIEYDWMSTHYPNGEISGMVE